MKELWEERWIEVPAGVTMTRRDSLRRAYATPLRFKGKRRVNGIGRPIDDVWEFLWVSKSYTVLQSEVTIAE